MTYEFKHIINQAFLHQKKGIEHVLATVVFLEGSSYRKPGVRMLISENGEMTGAVSGGCIEKEIVNQAQAVFKTHSPKIMTYDGRYRLGCEGILYILIEPFFVSDILFKVVSRSIKLRTNFQITSYFSRSEVSSKYFGSIVEFPNEDKLSFREQFELPKEQNLEIFTQKLQPCFKLLIFGGEHDAVKLCSMASLLGWEVDVITNINDPKTLINFPGGKSVTTTTPELLNIEIDSESAIILMNHNYALDLKYLIKLEPLNPKYIGILGSSKRREKIKNDLFDYCTNVSDEFLDNVYSPTGLNIGSVTPEEIALSILSEILAVTRNKKAQSLRDLPSKINN